MRPLVALLLLFSLFPAGAQAPTIAEVIAANPDLTTLFTLVSSANLLDVLSDPEANLTVFAPSNAAFEALPAESAELLMSDPTMVMRVLTYHVVQGRLAAADLAPGSALQTLEMEAAGGDLLGSQLTIDTGEGGALQVQGANILTADIEASNGVVHIVDALLLPTDVAVEIGATVASGPTFAVFGTLNPAGLETDAVFMGDAALSQALTVTAGFTDIANVQSVAFDSAGNMYVTVDIALDEQNAASEGGILVFDAVQPRRIAGPNTGIVSPKGLQVLETLGVVAIADNGARDIKLFALDADGDASPAATISVGEAGGVWDIWYDLINDSLYAAKTNGELVAYDTFSEKMGADGPDRVIIPTDADGNQISVNLHGVDVHYDSNTVIVSDVGDAQDNTDGQIFVMIAASISDGPTPVDARIAGDQTGLGNPVDLILDGTGIFVAEKANDTVLYFSDIINRSGDLNIAPDASQAAVKAESVALFPPREAAVIEELGLME
jgi:uncharacterized surface protein with fasciclin (FAS1) repeats